MKRIVRAAESGGDEPLVAHGFASARGALARKP
jgi:hypothetical protein